MAGVNKAIIVGRLGRDPEIRYSSQGLAIVRLAVATSEVWMDKTSGQRQERTEWHRVTVFGKMGENCEKYLSKGREVYVEGRLQTSSYEKDGQTHYSTDIIATNVQFLGSRQDTGGYQQGGGGGFQPQSSSPAQSGGGFQPQSRPSAQRGGGFQPSQGGGSPDEGGYQGSTSSAPSNAEPGMTGEQPPDDDIPF